MADDDLKDLVDAPRETLVVEIKSDLDLDDHTHRADLARHICALANYGGGFIVFGFDNNLRPQPLSGDVDKKFHRDRVSSIVNKYLEPGILCEVVFVTSTVGNRHPIIQVPAHASTPICSKADGPQDDKHKVQGIVSGRHYTRMVGPSGPARVVITQPDQWQSLIRRLVAAERAGLAAMIERWMDPRKAAPTNGSLEAWHNAAAVAFRNQVKSKGHKWPAPLDENYYQLSYEFILGTVERHAARGLISILERANSEMRDLVWTGWSMFYPFSRSPIAPHYVHVRYPGQGSTEEVLEANLLGETSLTSTLPDFWRVSEDGKATIVRAYREDRTSYPHPPGQTLSLFMAARELAEIVRHARAMAPIYNSLRSVRFRCEWHGLQGRELRDGESDPSIVRKARTDRVLSVTECKPEDLTNAWPEVVSELLARLARAFDPKLDPGPDWVRRVSSRFRSLPSDVG
jgi:hypothetical protein